MSFLGWPVGDFGVSGDDPLILMVDPEALIEDLMSSLLSLPEELTLLRLFSFWAKRYQNCLEFDVEPSSDILRPTVCSVL